MNEHTLNKMRSLIDSVCIGYSGNPHWEFFKVVLNNPSIQNICVLGVYYGRDIAYMAAILESLGRKNYQIVGVDKFEDSFCNDWPEKLRGLSWQEAGFGSPPAIEKAEANLFKLGLDLNVSLRCDLAENFLKSSSHSFDFIYIDISHDYATTIFTISLAIKKLNLNGIIGGDDFSDQDTWGVASAVRNSFINYKVFSNWLWLAQATDYQRNY